MIYETMDNTNDMTNVTNTTSPNTKISESIVPPVFQFTFGVLGNVLALVILVRNGNVHHWKPFYRLVGGLAITDLIGILFVYPAVMVRYGSGFVYVYPTELCNFISFMFSFCFLASAMIISAMSTERLFAVVFPFHYSGQERGKQACITLLVIWLTTAVISSLNIIGFGSVREFYPGSWCFLNFVSDNINDKINSMIYCFVGMVMLATTLVFNSIVITYLLWKSVFGRVNGSGGGRQNRTSDTFFYTVGLLVAVVIVFLVCWIPLMVRIVVNVTSSSRDQSSDLLAVRMTISNAIVDPWMYILVRKDVLQVFVEKVKCINAPKENISSAEVTIRDITLDSSDPSSRSNRL